MVAFKHQYFKNSNKKLEYFQEKKMNRLDMNGLLFDLLYTTADTKS